MKTPSQKSDTDRVLIICPFFSPNIGGVETHLDDLCKYLQEKRRDVQVITYQPLTVRTRGLKFEQRGSVKIRRLAWFGHNWFIKLEPYPPLEFLYLFPGLFFYGFFYLLRHRKRIQVIHAHGLVAAAVTAILAIVFGKHSVLSTHTTYALPHRPSIARFIKPILASFDKILCLSKQSKEELKSIGIESQKIDVYTYWIDQRIFRPLDEGECKKRFGWEGKFIVLFVGRLIPIKGVDLLIDAAKDLADPGVRFVIAGDGPMSENIKRAAQNYKNLLFVGPIENKNLVLYYNAADILIVPSTYEEGFGRVILEAVSCGTPVIASNRGGIVEAIKDSVGILIEPQAKNITRAIETLRDNSAKLTELRKNCRSYAEKFFSAKNANVIEKSYAN